MLDAVVAIVELCGCAQLGWRATVAPRRWGSPLKETVASATNGPYLDAQFGWARRWDLTLSLHHVRALGRAVVAVRVPPWDPG